MKKMLVALAVMALAVGAFGYTQSMGTAGEVGTAADFTYSSDLTGEGTANEAYVYAQFEMTGISFQVIDAPDCGVDADPTGSDDVWVITAVGSNDDISQSVAPFHVENTGGLAIDLGMWVSDISITDGDDWEYVTATEDILSRSLNKYRLFGVFAHGDWDVSTETAVDAELAATGNNWITTSLSWYGASKYHPTSEEVYAGKDNLVLPAACGTGAYSDLVDYCELRLRLNVGEGASDAESHAAQITLVSRITNGD